ncbi:MAG: biopolymer transporter ExbD [Thermoguttaceae bacterium]|jgi:biopolymer transport protein ExbD
MPIRTQFDEQPTLNLTAMLDVMFLLILFFALNTKFLDEERLIDVRLPQVADRGNLAAAADCRTVTVNQDGTITLDQSPITLDELTARLAAARRQSSRLGVLVRGDGRGEFQQIAAVLNACKQAGIGDVGISVRLAASGPVRK